MRFLTALFLAAALPLTPQESPVIRVTTRMVQVNVIVHDKKGPVADLKKEDFTLLDQGKPRTIASFSVASTNTTSAVQGGAKLPPNIYSNRLDRSAAASNNVTVILLDGLNTAFADQVYGRRAVIRFLETVKPEDRVALYVLGASLRVLHDFTGDFDQLRAVLGKSRGENTARLEASSPLQTITDNPEMDDFLNGANQAISDFYTIDRVRRTTEAMEAIARHVGSVPGRKNLIWMSGSFPFSIGLDGPLSLGDTKERRTFNEEVQRATRRLNEANVAVYPVDVRGVTVPKDLTVSAPSRNLTTPAPPPRINYRPPGLDTMQEMAARTGGIAFFNTNDLEGSIRKAIEDAQVTYTLGFYPGEGELDGRFHELRVKVARSGLDVRHRKGYVASEEPKRSEKQLLDEMKSSAASPLDLTEIGVTMRVDILNEPKPGTLQVTVVIDGQDLQIEKKEARWSGKGHVLILQVGPEQKVLSSIEESYNMNLTDENYRTLMARGLTVTKRIEPAKDLKQIRIVYLDRTSGKIGSLRMPIAQFLGQAAPAK